MSAHRKKKLKAKEEKDARAREKRLASLHRILNVMGIAHYFDDAPRASIDTILDQYGPSLAVEIDPSAEGDAEIADIRDELDRLIKKVQCETVQGRDVEWSLDDFFRGYPAVLDGIDILLEVLQDRRFSGLSEHRARLAEARRIFQDSDQKWFWSATGELLAQIAEATSRTFRIDRRVVGVKMSFEGSGRGARRRLILGLRIPRASRVTHGGSTRTAFPCTTYYSVPDIEPLSWNCPKLGIEGPRVDLPVYIGEHAIERLERRLPLDRAVVHKSAIDALELPEGLHRSGDGYLVDVWIGLHKVGYLVAHILPRMVFVKTFLFLTMRGTPESELLREKVGLRPSDIEHYRLDEFHTLAGRDIIKAPLLARVLGECGCGHLLSMVDPDVRVEWVDLHGDQFKERFGIREAKDGFIVGEKWMRWSDDLPLSAE